MKRLALATLCPLCLLACTTGLALSPSDLMTFADGITPNAEIHVSTTGSDVIGDGSDAKPYETLAHAIQFVTPGTSIILAPGTYSGGTFLNDITGSANAPIWIGGSTPTNRPLITGGSEGLHFVRARYVVVQNLEVTASANNGINCDDGGDYDDPDATRFLVFQNLSIHDIGGTGNQDGLKLSGVDDYWVLKCDFARCGGGISGSGVDHVGCHNGVIAQCTFQEMSGNAIQCKGGSSDIDITQCRIIDAGQRGINIGGSTGFEFFHPSLSTTKTNFEARAIRVTANIFKGCLAPIAFVGCIDSVVANNTILDPDNWHLRILQETVSDSTYDFYPCGRSLFINNLHSFDSSRLRGTDVNVGPNTEPETFAFANNLWYATNNPAASAPDLPHADINGIVGLDPLLNDADHENYAITLASPAATAGTVLAGTEFDFALEDYLTPPSIGAYEITGDLDSDQLPDRWELHHLGSTDTTSGTAGEDADNDFFSDFGEYVAGTDPTNASSFFQVDNMRLISPNRVVLEWQSVAGRTYDA